ncbi:hypothetical protein ON010_g6316 [Phytophthora cinnamomi]|nr:hypothetical protein ON010_g17049 [Phytophthora cinnamomi]KAJ8566806.1 hypothetical protein ON010_g6316 [Phytophthora cinnamomi]
MTYTPEFYQANKDRLKENMRRSYLKNKEARVAKQKEYDTANKDKINARRRERRRALKEAQTANETKESN